MDVRLLHDVALSAYLTFFGIVALILIGTFAFNHSAPEDDVEWERVIDEWRVTHYR